MIAIDLLAVVRFSVTAVLALLIVLIDTTEPASADQSRPGQHLSSRHVSDDEIQWLTGKQLDQATLSTLSASWADAPFRERLESFAIQQKIAIFVDRRIDPGKSINVAVRDATVEQFLWTVADEADCGVVRLGDLYYFGPVDEIGKIVATWEQIREQTRRGRRNYKVEWGNESSFAIPALVTPNQLIQNLSEEFRFQIEGRGLPHDLWNELPMPDISLDLQLTLILAGFGKSFERSRDGRRIAITEMPEIDKVKLEFGPYPNAGQRVADLRKQFPTSRISIRGQTVSAIGSPTELLQIKRELVFGQHTDSSNADERTFTLTTSNSRGVILATIARQTGNELMFDPSIRPLLEQQVEVSVEGVKMEELIEAVLRDSGLDYRLGDNRLLIRKR